MLRYKYLTIFIKTWRKGSQSVYCHAKLLIPGEHQQSPRRCRDCTCRQCLEVGRSSRGCAGIVGNFNTEVSSTNPKTTWTWTRFRDWCVVAKLTLLFWLLLRGLLELIQMLFHSQSNTMLEGMDQPNHRHATSDSININYSDSQQQSMRSLSVVSVQVSMFKNAYLNGDFSTKARPFLYSSSKTL